VSPKYISNTTLALALMGVSSNLAAQEAATSLGVSSSDGADADASTADLPSDSDEGSTRPLQRPFELGVFAGVLFPPEGHSLRDWDKPYQDYAAAALDVGLRAAVFPIDYVGIEGELAAMPTKTENDNNATLLALRAHLIGQIPTKYITPFLVVGGGRWMLDSDALGQDADRAFHFGIGAKVPVSDHLAIRLDARDTITAKQRSNDTQHWPEVLLGLSVGFGGGGDEPPPPPPPAAPVDTDGDGKTDDVDRCPNEAADTKDGCPIPDSDSDGVFDDKDECPNEAGTLENGCPDQDPDKDGIALPADKCPDVVGIAPDGCPDPDADKDGVPLPTDECPEEPETVNSYADADGCPDELPEAVKKFTGVIQGIQFDFGKAKVSRKSYPLLDEAVGVLKEHSGLRLAITGHTDSVGSRDRNLQLSEQRAQAVKDYMVEKGIAEDRLQARGAGPDEPIGDNATAAGRQSNRRIEFRIVQ
jgi:OOP family OmpA-OmpF porin